MTIFVLLYNLILFRIITELTPTCLVRITLSPELTVCVFNICDANSFVFLSQSQNSISSFHFNSVDDLQLKMLASKCSLLLRVNLKGTVCVLQL